jgi:hypothetical protein
VELRSSLESVKALASSLEASQRAAAAGGAAAADGSLTVADLRQELRSFAESLHE